MRVYDSSRVLDELLRHSLEDEGRPEHRIPATHAQGTRADLGGAAVRHARDNRRSFRNTRQCSRLPTDGPKLRAREDHIGQDLFWHAKRGEDLVWPGLCDEIVPRL